MVKSKFLPGLLACFLFSGSILPAEPDEGEQAETQNWSQFESSPMSGVSEGHLKMGMGPAYARFLGLDN